MAARGPCPAGAVESRIFVAGGIFKLSAEGNIVAR